MFVFRLDWMMEALPILVWGMLGIFLVTGILIAVVGLLNHLSGSKERKRDGQRRIQ